MKISRTLNVNASIDQLWEIIANDYENVGQWASAVQQSRANTEAKKVIGSPVGGRVCETDLGPFKETIEVFDSTRKELIYSAQGKAMPFFVKNLKGQWNLDRTSEANTTVKMTFTADLSFPFSTLMGWMMKMQFVKAIDKTLEELVHYAETGDIHPRKQSLVKAVT